MTQVKMLCYDVTAPIQERALESKRRDKDLGVMSSKVSYVILSPYSMPILAETYYPSTSSVEDALIKYFD